jgi:membrane fusion protein (multidrug efflux system)
MQRAIVLVLLLLLPTFLWKGCSFIRDRPKEVSVLCLQKGPISAYISVPGKVTGVRAVDVISRIPGHLLEVLIEEDGERVKRQQLLAKLDDAEANAQVIRATALLRRSREKIREVERKLARLRKVSVRGGEALQRVEDMEGLLRDSKAEFEVQQAERDLAQIHLRLHHIVAPFAGMVVHRNAEVGQAVQPALGEATTLFTIVDDSTLHIEAQVDSGDSGLIALQDIVEVTTDAWPDLAWKENVYYMAPAVSENEHDGVNTFLVKVTLGQEAPDLLIGQQVDLSIRIAHRQNAIAVPYTAIREEKGGPFVAVLESGRARLQRIEIGISSFSEAEVLSGISEGALLIRDNAVPVQDGEMVHLRDDRVASCP